MTGSRNPRTGAPSGWEYPATLSYDYEHRLTAVGGTATDSFSYACDGTEAASTVLTDGSAVYTPGLSERRGSVSKFTHADALGSTRLLTDSSQSANGLPVLTDFDIFAAAGGRDRAVVKTIHGVKADAHGSIVVHLIRGKIDQPAICGLQILDERP